jgi:hypothetical protein
LAGGCGIFMQINRCIKNKIGFSKNISLIIEATNGEGYYKD